MAYSMITGQSRQSLAARRRSAAKRGNPRQPLRAIGSFFFAVAVCGRVSGRGLNECAPR